MRVGDNGGVAVSNAPVMRKWKLRLTVVATDRDSRWREVEAVGFSIEKWGALLFTVDKGDTICAYDKGQWTIVEPAP